MIHLDTSFLIRALSPGTKEDEVLRDWLRGRKPIGISAVSWTEFLCGPVAASDAAIAERILGDPAAFDAAVATVAANLFNHAGRRPGSLIDCMIAASAIRADAELATSNPRDFRRLESLGRRLANGR